MKRVLGLAVLLLATPAQSQDATKPAGTPPRAAVEQDLTLLNSPKFKAAAVELGRMGLHQTVGRTCRAFVTADSVRYLETPVSVNGTDLNLPYLSFLIWSPDRPFADAVLYHVFGPTDQFYKQPQKLPADATEAKVPVTIALAPRHRYLSADDVARERPVLAKGPLLREGGTQHWTVQPYALPTEPDAATSTFPGKTEKTLRTACLTDPERVTNCLCAGTD